LDAIQGKDERDYRGGCLVARSRNIKPGFFLNDKLAEVEPLGRLLFAGLWTVADREGRLEDRPKKIKACILPYDDCDIDELLNQLHNRNFIIRYEAYGNNYIAITNWKKHQNPHVKENASEIPAPDKLDSSSMEEQDKHSASMVQEQDLHETDPADSLNLIPDTFKPIYIPYKEIIEHLNLRAGTSYKHSSKSTQKHIHARWEEGHRLEDFITVIDNKVVDWLDDVKYSKYLRPETLFGTKFEGYLNRPSKPDNDNPPKEPTKTVIR